MWPWSHYVDSNSRHANKMRETQSPKAHQDFVNRGATAASNCAFGAEEQHRQLASPDWLGNASMSRCNGKDWYLSVYTVQLDKV